MNRLKFWLFALVVIGLAAFALQLVTAELAQHGLDATDRQLRGALARVEAAERSATNELAALAGLAAQDARLQASLHPGAEAPSPVVKGLRKVPPPPPPSPTAEQLDGAADQAAAEAVAAAVGSLGMARGDRRVLVATRDTLVRKPPADADAIPFLEDALERKVRRGYAVLGGKLHAGAAVPVGDRGALAVFVPVDAAWAADKASDTGAVLILTAPKAKAIVSGKVDNADVVARTAPRGAVPASGGQLGPVDLKPSWLPLELPKVRSLLGKLPAHRVIARGLPDLQGGRMAIVLATRGGLESAVRLEWYGLCGLVLALVLAVVFGFLIQPTEVAAALPPILLDAARKVEKGDFSVRAPVLAGKLGTFAAALNKAVEAAQSGAQPTAGSVTSEFFARAPEPAPEDPFAMPSRASRAEPEPALEDPARLDGANLTGAAFEAAPVAAPRPPAPDAAPVVLAPEAPALASPAVAPATPAPAAAAIPATPIPTPAPAPRAAAAPAAIPAASPTDLLAGAARVAPGGEGDEEHHWRETFRDFVRTRGECGESAEGLTYERFRQKLESNKSALVAKYGCKTVRFQVYVKDGKAALKATPVR